MRLARLYYLALFFLEPAILLIDRSADKYVHITHWCLEYVHFLVHEFYAPLKQFIGQHMFIAMRTVLEKGVIRYGT